MNIFGYTITRNPKPKAGIGGAGGGSARRLTSDLTTELNKLYNWYYTETGNPSLSSGINNYSGQDIIDYGRTIEGLDLHLRGIVEARMGRVAGLKWAIFDQSGYEISSDDYDQETQLVVDALRNIRDFDTDRYQMAESLKHGYSVLQSVWSAKSGMLFPEYLRQEYPENFDFDDGRSTNNLIPETCSNALYMREGISQNYTPAVNPGKWLVTTYDKEYENRRGVGLYKKCVFASWAKINIISWFMNFCERSGSGTWIAQITDENMLPTKSDGSLYTAEEINAILKSISVSSRGVLPSGVELATLTFDKDSDVDMFLRGIVFFQDQQSKIVWGGQSATTDLNDVGSFAATSNFMKQEKEVNLRPDINMIYEAINYPLAYNVLALNRSAEVADNWLKEYKVSACLPESDPKIEAETRKINAEAESIEQQNEMRQAAIIEVDV